MRPVSLKVLVVLIVIAIALPTMLFSRLLVFKVMKGPFLDYANNKNFLILESVRSELENRLFALLSMVKKVNRDSYPFKTVKENFPHITSVLYINRKGKVEDSLPKEILKRGADFSENPVFRDVSKKGTVTFTALTNFWGNRKEIVLSIPVKDGFILATIDPVFLRDILKKLELLGFFHFFIVNEEGIPIVHVRDEYVYEGKNLKELLCVKEGLTGKTGPFFEKIEGRDFVTYTHFMGFTRWLLCIGEEKERLFFTYEKVKKILLYSFLLTTLFSIFLGVFIAKRVVKAIEGLSELAEEIKTESYKIVQVKPITKEVQRIYSTLLELANRLKEREERLRKEKERFETVIEETPVPVMVLDRKGRFIHLNRSFVETFGYTLQDLRDVRAWLRIAHPDPGLRKKVISTWRESSDKPSTPPVIFPVRRKDGKERYVKLRAVQIEDLFIVVAEDITEEKETRENLEIIFNESRDGIYLLDKDGNFIDINRAGLEIYGYESKEEFLRLHINDIFADEEERKRFLRKLRKKGHLHSYESIHKRKDGEKIIVRDTAAVICNEKGEIIKYFGIVRDVTNLKKLEEQFVQAQKMEVIGRLTGGIAHDFNNMLTAILGNIQLAEMVLEKDHKAQKHLSSAKDAAEKSTGFIKQLLAFSRRQILELKPVNINNLIIDLAKILRRTIRENIELELILEEKDPTTLADIAQINQAILNLIVNAVDAIEEKGKITIETSSRKLDEEYVKTHPEVQRPGSYVVISITDTGSGIPKEIMDKIFEPFFTTKKDGTGLGLSVVYGIIKQHGGFINVYSEVGKGTTFRIYLPKIEAKEEQEEKKEPLKGGSETILVVEDDVRVQRIVEEMLKRLGYNVFIAKDGEEAIEIFKEKADIIDLSLIDVVMPKMSGKETYEMLRKIKKDIKVIFMTGYSENLIHTKFIPKEGYGFLSKPFTIEMLAKKIRDFLDTNK